MRLLLPFATALLCMPVQAQNDAHQHQPENNIDHLSTSGNVGQVKVEDDNDPFKPNAFTGSFRMELHRYANAVEDADGPMNMHYWSSPDMTLMQMAAPSAKGSPQTDMKILTDLKGKWTYFLMTDPRGNKTAMKSRKQKVIIGEDKADDLHDFKVTNETKMIDGHKCTKVVGTTEDGTWTGWVAKDIAVPFSDLANSMSRSAMQRGRQNWEGLSGFPLEFETADKDGKMTMQAFVKDLQVGNVDPSVFSITDYKVMEVPGIQRQEKQ
ncbi:MAG: DUF4412 domain-containing protein [Bacteroidetes bacterium]|nr:DUF4412 domain-containing protein [Bacteroidota bacterium]MBS1941961.1 DUF4412 domain-containing protein [Bacteroidota bacterium]